MSASATRSIAASDDGDNNYDHCWIPGWAHYHGGHLPLASATASATSSGASKTTASATGSATSGSSASSSATATADTIDNAYAIGYWRCSLGA
ncbi:unnamed protein product [Aspergillus oryzae]|uniref:Unnamed protein product n=2 Tax=Aspergillus oryzae TaxID=5062 RepID=A0AAN5C3H3_ASPOZ|nr:unnamed protein product [Aspergillus oryzae]GMF90562.1 unnamed protein product [Aspergillus oryzae]GMG07409.1 unnamed protein product [Aspergillus oryzae]GMG37714.1 unnamed protein product [Aspergillus oryzae]GMG55002.1 unnamed protein product [Aspergillus oryzae var. brunneus]